MANKKPYKLKPEHIRKLRALKSEEKAYLDAVDKSWANGEATAAKAAVVLAEQAHAKWLAYFNKLRGWEENGVPATGHAI